MIQNFITGNAIENINPSELSQVPVQIIIMAIIAFVIALLVSPLLLWLATKILKIKNNYKKAFITTLIFFAVNIVISVIAGFISRSWIINIIVWVIGFLFAFWLIKYRYELDLKNGFLVGLMWMIFNTVLSWIISLVLLVGGLIVVAFLK